MTLTLIEIIPEPRPKKWRKAHGIFAIDEVGNTYCNPAIGGSSLLLCALIDHAQLRVVVVRGKQIILVPTAWLKQTSFAQYADVLDAQIKHAAKETEQPSVCSA